MEKKNKKQIPNVHVSKTQMILITLKHVYKFKRNPIMYILPLNVEYHIV